MSTNILIIGESGTGKSTAIRTLPAAETFIINVLDKPLPFRGARKKYTKLNAEGHGNHFASDKSARIINSLDYVNKKRPDIKYIVVDDFGYTIANNYMERALEMGYQKFAEIGRDAWEVFNKLNEMREDLTIFVTMHSTSDAFGKSKPKTIGKMLDEKYTIEGAFTVVLHSDVTDGDYSFITNSDGLHMAKSPLGMFADLKIPNDLKVVSETVHAYYDEDIEDA